MNSYLLQALLTKLEHIEIDDVKEEIVAVANGKWERSVRATSF